MPSFLEVDHVDRSFDLPDGGQYVALKNVSLQVQQGEFISLVGHSGCGKSTLLNIVAGLDQPTEGGVVLEGRQVDSPVVRIVVLHAVREVRVEPLHGDNWLEKVHGNLAPASYALQTIDRPTPMVSIR